MKMRGKAICLFSIIPIIITSAACQSKSDNSQAKKDLIAKEDTGAKIPFDLKKVEKGRMLHKHIIGKYSKLNPLLERPSLFGALTENPYAYICVPISDWQGLSKDDRDDLAQYASSLIQEVKEDPFTCSQISVNAPVAPMVRKNVLKMTYNNWGIFAGGFSDDGREINLDKQVASGLKKYNDGSTQRNQKPNNSLDQLAATITVGSERFILSYDIGGGFAILNINPSIWNALSRGEQQQFGDSLASTTVWKDMGLINARLLVYTTEVGRIKPLITGGMEFILN